MNENATIDTLYHEGRGKGEDGTDYVFATLYYADIPNYWQAYILHLDVGWTDPAEQPDPLWHNWSKDIILKVYTRSAAIRATIRIFDKLVKDHPNLE